MFVLMDQDSADHNQCGPMRIRVRSTAQGSQNFIAWQRIPNFKSGIYVSLLNFFSGKNYVSAIQECTLPSTVPYDVPISSNQLIQYSIGITDKKNCPSDSVLDKVETYLIKWPPGSASVILNYGYFFSGHEYVHEGSGSAWYHGRKKYLRIKKYCFKIRWTVFVPKMFWLHKTDVAYPDPCLDPDPGAITALKFWRFLFW
jgi:hypothetical protein